MTRVGVSPRVRGNPIDVYWDDGTGGSIPACAGEPPLTPDPLDPFEVYPRVCGGTDSMAKDTPRNKGLSPRVRGNHRCRNHKE